MVTKMDMKAVQVIGVSTCKTAQIAIDKSGDLSLGPLLNFAAIP